MKQLGGPERLVLREVPSPPPGAGEVKVALHARGVSFVDVLDDRRAVPDEARAPVHSRRAKPPGSCWRSGPGVQVAPGDRVLVPGGFADEVVVAASRVTPLPASVSFEAAAAFRANYCTAYYGLQRGRLRAGDVLLVLGAAGGVGLAAVDVGKLLGATVIAAASSDEKLAVCKQMGADHVDRIHEGIPGAGQGADR